MNRRALLLMIGAAAVSPRVRAQPAARVPRVGVLWPVADDDTLAAFRAGLRELGYVEGRTVAVEYRYARGRDELLPQLAEELVKLEVDVLVTWGVTAARVLRKATTAVFGLKETEGAARSLGFALQVVTVREAAELERAFSAMAGERAQAVIVLADMLFIQHSARLVELSEKHRLAVVHFSQDFVVAGGLMAYATSFADMFRCTAVYVDKILKGAGPGELPIERPTKFDLVVNRKAAGSLGLLIPTSILMRADEVIE